MSTFSVPSAYRKFRFTQCISAKQSFYMNTTYALVGNRCQILTQLSIIYWYIDVLAIALHLVRCGKISRIICCLLLLFVCLFVCLLFVCLFLFSFVLFFTCFDLFIWDFVFVFCLFVCLFCLYLYTFIVYLNHCIHSKGINAGYVTLIILSDQTGKMIYRGKGS